ncbi:MAG TPA: tellurite resistance TerB family protein [Caulobacterales bacterium]|nr:tellurite resistance TerB family protein [Caulobacterales bacterium]
MGANANWEATAHLFEEAASLVSVQDYEQRVQAFSLGPPRLDWSVPEAFLAVLLAAAYADKEVSPEEQEQLKGLRKRSRILKALTNDQVNKANASAMQKLQQRGDAGLLEACECLPNMLRLPVFALAIDLVLADGKLTQSEREFISKIAGWLQIDKGVEWQISQVMLIKNNC